MAPDAIDQIRAHLDAGEHARAVAVATDLVRAEPNNMLAVRLEAHARLLLEHRYIETLGSTSTVPRYVRSTTLDKAAQAVLALVDGKRSVAHIVDGCGLPRIVALRALCDMQKLGVIDTR